MNMYKILVQLPYNKYDLMAFQINADTSYALVFQDGSQLYDAGDCSDNVTLMGDIVNR